MSPPPTSIPPIRSLSIRSAPHHPSTRTLKPSEQDGGSDTPRSSSTHTITEAISHLENLVKQITELAQDKGAVESEPSAKSNKRRTSETITARGWQCLNSAETSPKSQVADPTNGKKVTFDRLWPFRNAQHVAEVAEGSQGEVEQGIQACSPAHEEVKTHKAPAAPPEITLTQATDEASSEAKQKAHEAPPGISFSPATKEASPGKSGGMSDAETYTRKVYLRNDPIPPPRHPAPAIPTNGTNLGLPSQLKIGPLLSGDEAVDADRLMVPEVRHETFTQMFGIRHNSSTFRYPRSQTSTSGVISLKRVNHVDLWNKPETFDVHHSCDHAPVARNWPDSRKRLTATIVCINTACIGLIIGIYSGEVPAIQYVIADFHHYAILGNVFLYSGLAISSFLLWPLPLLHGRKVYTITGLALAFGLQIPQGIVVTQYRMPDDFWWRVILLLSRALSGLVLGLVSINTFATLLDVFGSSLQSQHPHGETVDPFDVRRHGGGLGLWLAAWTWCKIGSIGVGFVIGAFIIDHTSVDWGFWTALCLLMFVLLLNLLTPEVRRAAFRRTIADFVGISGPFSRVTRGEIKMHLDETGPYWWGEELQAGLRICWKMVRQPGFLGLAVYAAWVYAQFTLILMLLGALCSRHYRYRPLFVGICTLSLAGGAILAVPFQKASLFSRARKNPPRTDSSTFQTSRFWTSHLVRRALFTVLLPLGGIGYALTARGPPFPVAVPCIMAAIVGYFSNLAMAECFGLVMETFDTSDLQPGMTGRPPHGSAADRTANLRTNFTSYPRVCAGVAVIQSLSFMLASAATGLGGRMERRIGAMQASGVMAGILMLLTVLLTLVVWRWKTVQMIPSQQIRRSRANSTWEPTVLGHPSGLSRKISILESGAYTRWTEIRLRNRLESRLTNS